MYFMYIIPALLNTSQDEFSTQLTNLSKYFNHFQIDIADGVFVPNTTIQVDEIRSALSVHGSSLGNIFCDFHLMVNDYEAEIKKLQSLSQQIKTESIFIHLSLLPDYERLTMNYESFSFGLVLNPEDTVESLAKSYDLTKLKHIQIMSVNPGFQGAPFIPETLKKVEHLRLKYYRNKIYLDGGINEKTLPTIMEQKYKPDVLCIGSYLTKAENLGERVLHLQSITNGQHKRM